MSSIEQLHDHNSNASAPSSQRTRRLFPTLAMLVDRIADDAARDADVITWGSPVPAFGDPTVARVATLGLNPSNREFVNSDGTEISGGARRFHTLRSLGLGDWGDADADHLDCILTACSNYFMRNPYDRWFRKLDSIVVAAGASFYDNNSPACHLDLIPYATRRKWTELTARQRAGLLRLAGDSLGLLLRHSSVRVLILNGQSVITHFEQLTGITLDRTRMPRWALPRRSGACVHGYASYGRVDAVCGYPLEAQLLVIGFNHNLQSSYGVTSQAIDAIREWIRDCTSGALSSAGALSK